MNVSRPFIRRPVATTLLALGLVASGLVAYPQLPVAPLPAVEFPVVSVQAVLPGASPQVMASTVASPLERHLGQIADVNEMTSSSSVGSARITLQFGLDRDIDGAARDVQAAINAARADLPTSLRSNPTYRKVNPADAPIIVLALTSDTLTRGQIYDAASTVVAQQLSQVDGVGEVTVNGSSLPAVRVELNPQALDKYGIGLEDVRAALGAANAHSPKGAIDTGSQHYQIYANDQANEAAAYRALIVAYRNGAPVRLSDVGEITDSVENIRNIGLANGKAGVGIIINRSPNANIVATVDRVKALIPMLRASISPAIDIAVAVDRSTTIRASLREVGLTLLIAVLLVMASVFVFLRDPRSALVPVVAVPVSLIGTLGIMYLLGYSLDNLSLMALTVATGFVVDDAIVVLENITRHVQAGMPRREAAITGAGEVGFTVLSMSLSLIAVFIPILLMGGLVGRLFREFAVTLSAAILVSLVVSLTLTPMMCSLLLRQEGHGHGRLYRLSARLFAAVLSFYRRTLAFALDHPRLILAALAVTLALNFHLYATIPKGFFPQQDTGQLIGSLRADQAISFQAMAQKLAQYVDIVKQDPAVNMAVGAVGGGQSNSGFMFVALKPLAERAISADQVIQRLRKALAVVPGTDLFLQSVQDIRVGGRQGNAQYQYTLQGDSPEDLALWVPKLTQALQADPRLADVNNDQQSKGLESDIVIDRDTAARLGISVSQIDNTLYDAFGQRQVSTIYVARNEYHVVMEVAPRYWQNPDTLKQIYVSTSGGSVGGSQASNAVAGTFTAGAGPEAAAQVAADAARNQATNSIGATGRAAASTGTAVSTSLETMVPLSAVAHFAPGSTPLAINHQGLFVASTITFNLAPGLALSDAVTAITQAQDRISMPATIHGGFQGTASVFQQSLAGQPMLILAALVAVYVVLGILYESYAHPLTILSTLPSAGVGALLALSLFGMEFSIIALIGVILLIGIVKKNAIMMIDFALTAEREHNKSSREAIFEACLLRFRPIMMTTMAALFGALPLAIGFGEGSEMRRPLGIAIMGGLILSQILTLYTTPVIYIYMDRFRLWCLGLRHGRGAVARRA